MIESDSSTPSASHSISSQPTAVRWNILLLMMATAGLVHFNRISIYADVAFPVYQHFTGDQVASPALFKLQVSYAF